MANQFRLILLWLLCLQVQPLAAQSPVANFTVNQVSGCNPLHVIFTSTSTGNPTSYNWNLGNNVTSTQQNPSTTYTSPGTYSVTLTVSNANGTNTKTVTNMISVLPGPAVTFNGNPVSGCPPINVSFSNTTSSNVPGPITYSWNFGDGSPLNSSQNPSHFYPTPGQYTITLYATDAQGCTNYLVKPSYIQVHAPPLINFTAPSNQCDAPAIVNFSSTVNGNGPYIYSWDFGDGGSANTATPTHTYANPGSYTVRLIVQDMNGCRDTLIKSSFMNVGNISPNFTVNGVCVNAPQTFINNTNVMDSVKWDFGDGGTDTAKNPVHIYAASGTFNAKLVVYYGNCKDSITKPVIVHPSPIASFIFNPLEPCPPPVVVNFTSTSLGASTYSWDFYDGGSSGLQNPAHTYTTDSFFAVKLTATSNQGCPATAIDTVKIYYIYPDLNPNPPKGCIPFTTTFNPIFHSRHPVRKYDPIPPPTLYPYPVVSYFWDLGNGNTSASATPTSVYTVPGVHNVTLNFSTSNGCIFTDSIKVSSGYKPTASFTISEDSLCANMPVIFTSTSTGPSPLSHEWDFGEGGNGSGGSFLNPVTHYYSTSGIHTVTLIASHFGCGDTLSYEDTITVFPPSSFFDHFHDTTCNELLKVWFLDSSIRATSRLWIFGDGTIDTSKNPVHNYTTPGIKNVFLITYNDTFGCVDTASIPLKLHMPAYVITTPDTAICRGDSVFLTPNLTGFTSLYQLRYHWWVDSTNAKDTILYTGQGMRFNESGIFDIHSKTWTYWTCGHPGKPFYTWYPGCWMVDSQEVLVAKPYAGFTASPLSGCSPLTVTFTDTSGNTPGAYSVTRLWNFGNGIAPSINPTIIRTYNTGGQYNVQLIVTDNVGCSDTLTKSKYIDVRNPVAAFTCSDSNACIGQLIKFNDSTKGSSSYVTVWYFGDGSSDTAINPIHSYSQPGLYNVKLVVVDAFGCHDSTTKIAYINISKPAAKFQLSDTLAVCPPLNLVVTNTSTGALTYAWDFGNGSSSTLQNPTSSYITPGIYNIRLIAISAENCRDTAYAQVNVLGYSGALTYNPQNGCAPLSVGFKSQLYNVPSIIWDFSDGVTQNANGSDTTSHIYTSPGAYVPKLVLSDNTGCQNSSLGLDTIKVDAVLAGFTTTPLCINTPITFTDTSLSYFSPVVSWSWSLGNGQTSTTHSPITTYPSAGTYPLTLSVTNGQGCKDTVNRLLIVYGLPTIFAGPDTIICSGDAAQLIGNGGVSYTWTPSVTLSCSDCTSPLAFPTASTSYIVTGTDGNGCKNEDTVVVHIQYVTVFDGGKGGEICEDSSIHLLASGANRYQWSPAATLDDSEVPDPIASPLETTTYTVIAWEGSCPPDTGTVRVVVHPKPRVDAGSDVKIVAGTSTILMATGSNIQKFLWSPAQTLSCESCSNPTATPTVTTRYILLATSNHGCRRYDTVTVYILCDNSQLFIPNTFSPNNDGQNDHFYPRGEGLEIIRSFRIYNRWGEKLFERRDLSTNDPANGWDGSFNGNILPPDTYVYVIDAICHSGESISWKGDVTLLR